MAFPEHCLCPYMCWPRARMEKLCPHEQRERDGRGERWRGAQKQREFKIKTPAHAEKSLLTDGPGCPPGFFTQLASCAALMKSHLGVWVWGMDRFEIRDGKSE